MRLFETVIAHKAVAAGTVAGAVLFAGTGYDAYANDGRNVQRYVHAAEQHSPFHHNHQQQLSENPGVGIQLPDQQNNQQGGTDQQNNGTQQAPQGAVRAGWLHTQGDKIVDSQGRQFLIRGVDDGRLNGCGNFKAAPVSDAMKMRAAGFNAVRASIDADMIEPNAPTVNGNTIQHHWNQAYLKLLDDSIKAYRQAGLKVILDMHQTHLTGMLKVGPACHQGLPHWFFTQGGGGGQACSFFANQLVRGVPIRPFDDLHDMWQMLGGRYVNDPTVIGADPMNEPQLSEGCKNVLKQNLARMYEILGSGALRGNPALLMMCEDVAYHSYNKWGLQLIRRPNLPNLVLSWHEYAKTWSELQPKLQDHLNQAHRFGAPLWIGETDMFNATGNGSNGNYARPNNSDLQQFIKYLNDNNINLTIWEWRHRGHQLSEDRIAPLRAYGFLARAA